MKIVLTGGGSGGHLMPLIAVAGKIKEGVPDAEFVFIGPGGKLERDIIGKENIPMHDIMVGKFRRYFSFKNLADFFKIPIGIVQAMFLLLKIMPDAIFSKGGYASLPVVLVGWIYRIPIMIHESDAVPGMANGVLSKFADRVAVAYPEAEKEFPEAQVVLTGNPLRKNINQGSAQKAREKFGLIESKKIIYVTGGSQGAQSINTKILDILPELLKKYQIIHQTGENNFDEVRHRAGEMGVKPGYGGYHIMPFIYEGIADIFAAADLVVSRASANTISEIAANGKPSILIPLQNAANDHQRMNAYALAKFGGCVVLEENNLGKNLLLSRIEEIMESPELQEKLSRNIRTFYHPDAAEKIAQGILGMIKN
ncbi:MAG: undecaprenyldiphospho-muramoylpentapeptide beta-N-acetylglucosaminyltransferase [Parcubacteria group bacterium]